jgi:hypothetical protein
MDGLANGKPGFLCASRTAIDQDVFGDFQDDRGLYEFRQILSGAETWGGDGYRDPSLAGGPEDLCIDVMSILLIDLDGGSVREHGIST